MPESTERHRPDGASGRNLALAFLVWVFLWDNARTLPTLADAHITTVAPIPSFLRFAEVGVIALLFVASVINGRHRTDPWRNGVVLVFCLLLLSAVSIVIATVSRLTHVIAAAQMVYGFVAPLLLVAIVAILPSRTDDAERTLKALVIAVGLSASVAWWQVIHLHAFGDDVHGAMRDAHNFASAVWIVVLWWIARLSAGVGTPARNILGLAFFAPVALYASNEKSNVALAMVLFGILLVYLWKRGWGYRVVICASLLGAPVIGRALLTGQMRLPDSFGHLQLVLDNLSGIGFFKGYGKVVDVTKEYPRVLLIGTGPASYGSIKAVDPIMTGGQVPPLAAEYTADSYRIVYAANGLLGSYLEESTDLSAFFVELGPIALLLFGGAVWYLVIQPARRAVRDTDARNVAVGRWVVWSTCFALTLSIFTAFYGWSATQATVWPIMLVAGLLWTQRPSPPASAAGFAND